MCATICTLTSLTFDCAIVRASILILFVDPFLYLNTKASTSFNVENVHWGIAPIKI